MLYYCILTPLLRLHVSRKNFTGPFVCAHNTRTTGKCQALHGKKRY